MPSLTLIWSTSESDLTKQVHNTLFRINVALKTEQCHQVITVFTLVQVTLHAGSKCMQYEVSPDSLFRVNLYGLVFQATINPVIPKH